MAQPYKLSGTAVYAYIVSVSSETMFFVSESIPSERKKKVYEKDFTERFSVAWYSVVFDVLRIGKSDFSALHGI